jgi:hypothetical protein
MISDMLEQTGLTLTILATIIAFVKGAQRVVQNLSAGEYKSQSYRIKENEKRKLYDKLLQIYRTHLTGKLIDDQIIDLEESMYKRYKKLEGNGFIDKIRNEWLEETTKIIKKGFDECQIEKKIEEYHEREQNEKSFNKDI